MLEQNEIKFLVEFNIMSSPSYILIDLSFHLDFNYSWKQRDSEKHEILVGWPCKGEIHKPQRFTWWISTNHLTFKDTETILSDVLLWWRVRWGRKVVCYFIIYSFWIYFRINLYKVFSTRHKSNYNFKLILALIYRNCASRGKEVTKQHRW